MQWNNHPVDLRLSRTFTIFKTHPKSHLFNLSFPSVWLYYWLHHWLFLYRALEADCAAYASLNLSLLHYITLHYITLHYYDYRYKFVSSQLCPIRLHGPSIGLPVLAFLEPPLEKKCSKVGGWGIFAPPIRATNIWSQIKLRMRLETRSFRHNGFKL